MNFYFIGWLYRTSKNHENSILFALMTFLQRNVFFFKTNKLFSIFKWNLAHEDDITIKSDANFLIRSFEVDFKNVISFGLAIWESTKTNIPFLVYLNCFFYGKWTSMNAPRFYANHFWDLRLSKHYTIMVGLVCMYVCIYLTLLKNS